MTSEEGDTKGNALPMHPEDNNNVVKVTQWRKKMFAHLLTKKLGVDPMG